MQIENWQDLQPHPLANLVPRMNPTQQTALNKDIAEKGLIAPIVVISDGNGGFQILDGRNRHEACVVEKIDPNANGGIGFWEYSGDDPAGFVVSTLQRKDMTWPEKTVAIKNLLAQQPNLSSRSVAQEFGVSHHTVEKLRQEHPEQQANERGAHSTTEEDSGVSDAVSPASVLVERVESSGRRARGRRPDTPEVKAAKEAAKAAAKADGERKPISSVRETRIDFVNNWLQADLPGALNEILRLVSGYDGRIQFELSGAERHQHIDKWVKVYGCYPTES